MERLLILVSFCILATTSVADQSCNWHAINDLTLDYAHYDAEHNSDNDVIGCENIPRFEPSTTYTDAEIAALNAQILAGNPRPDLKTQTKITSASPAPAVPSVELLVNSNFRRGPGLAFAIVGGGSPGSVYQWTSAAYGSGGWIWCELVLPAGSGWVRGDLIRLLDAVETQNSP